MRVGFGVGFVVEYFGWRIGRCDRSRSGLVVEFVKFGGDDDGGGVLVGVVGVVVDVDVVVSGEFVEEGFDFSFDD